MVMFPISPPPANVSSPEVFDPILRFGTDAQYELRRSLISRPRFRYLLTYLGMTVSDLRFFRDFLQVHRLGVQTMSFMHPTAYEVLTAGNTTPVTLTYMHGLTSGQYVNIGSGPAGLLGAWPITRLDNTTIALVGTVASGAAAVTVAHYLPNAVARFQGDVWESPTMHMGPDQLGTGGRRQGRYSFQVRVEEIL